METNRLIQLLELIKNHLIIGNENNQSGICKAVDEVYAKYHDINCNEYVFIKQYLNTNRPTPINEYKQFYQQIVWLDNNYWWRPIHKEPQTKQIRINFLTELINNIK